MGLAETIDAIADHLVEIIDASDFADPISVIPSLTIDASAITTLLASSAGVPSFESADIDEAFSEQIAKFNESVYSGSKEFALMMALQKVADTYLSQLQPESETQSSETGSDTTTVTYDTFTTSQENLTALGKLALLFDHIILLLKEDLLSYVTNQFYVILQSVLEFLLNLSNTSLGIFWFYLESRIPLITSSVFNSKVTLHRIAILGICNGITDKFYNRQSDARLDSYKKDTFNDLLHARVRTFLGTILEFDDLTGLNKYFAIANRVSREPQLPRAKTSDDELLREVLSFYDLLRDPYRHLRNPRLLSTRADSLVRLHKYLLGEEAKYAKVHPPRDVYAIPKKGKNLERNAENGYFFAEQYWLAPFEDSENRALYDRVVSEDQKFAESRFDSSKFRKLLLFQLYLVCNFFVELQQSRKRLVIRNVGGLANTRHIVEESTPELLISKFQMIKREILRLIREWDVPLSFMLQHITTTEEHWWGWLIYGKLANGKPLLSVSALSEDELTSTNEKFEAIYPLKTKRYFNTFATPQLSRRMKVKTGLSSLKNHYIEESDYSQEIRDLDTQLEGETDVEVRKEIIEQKNFLIWKKLKNLRGSSWLEMDQLLKPDDLGQEQDDLANDNAVNDENKEEEKKEEEKKEEEKKEEINGLEKTEALADKVSENVTLVSEEPKQEIGTVEEAAGAKETISTVTVDSGVLVDDCEQTESTEKEMEAQFQTNSEGLGILHPSEEIPVDGVDAARQETGEIAGSKRERSDSTGPEETVKRAKKE